MGTRVVNKVSSRHFPWRPSLIQTPYRSAATQDEGAAPRRIRGKYFVFSKGEFFHNYPLARSAFVFGRGTNFRRQPVDIPLKALGQVNKSLLYTQTSFSGLDSSSSLFFSPLPLFQRSSSRLLAFIKITDRGAFVKKTRYLVLSWKRRAPRALLTFEPYLKGIFQDSNRPFRRVYPQEWYFSTGNGILSCLESDEYYPITENSATRWNFRTTIFFLSFRSILDRTKRPLIISAAVTLVISFVPSLHARFHPFFSPSVCFSLLYNFFHRRPVLEETKGGGGRRRGASRRRPKVALSFPPVSRILIRGLATPHSTFPPRLANGLLLGQGRRGRGLIAISFLPLCRSNPSAPPLLLLPSNSSMSRRESDGKNWKESKQPLSSRAFHCFQSFVNIQLEGWSSSKRGGRRKIHPSMRLL